MSMLIRVLAVSICALATACGGGGSSGGGSDAPPVPPQSGGPTGNPGSVPPSAAQGVYFGAAIDNQDQEYFVQALVTPDGKAIIYIEAEDEDSTAIPLTVIEGTLVESNGNTALSQARAFISNQSPTPATGMFMETGEDSNLDATGTVVAGGKTFNVGLVLDSRYNTPSSLQAISGNYGDGIDNDSSVVIDSGGNVIVTPDSASGCRATGMVSADLPAVNAYALNVTLSGCIDSAENGVYTGRVSLLGPFLVLFAHSNTRPLFDPEFERN